MGAGAAAGEAQHYHQQQQGSDLAPKKWPPIHHLCDLLGQMHSGGDQGATWPRPAGEVGAASENESGVGIIAIGSHLVTHVCES